jgi:hypothetical protein
LAPLSAPGAKFTLKVRAATLTGWTPTGAAGAPTTIAFEAADGGLTPSAFVAVTVQE